MASFTQERVLDVHHWTDTLFSFTTTRDPSFRFRNGEFTINIALVREALHERTTLLNNAPHLAQPLPFVMPSYKLWETPFYGMGLKMYDALAGKAGLGATEFLSRDATLRLLPTARSDGLKGGVKYWDGQFDDARLAVLQKIARAEKEKRSPKESNLPELVDWFDLLQQDSLNPYVRDVLGLIAAHYRERLSVEQTADALGISASYLSRKLH